MNGVKRETRANVIFIVVLLAATVPGGIIVFKRKLDPSAPTNALPESRRTNLVYISPMDAPELQRYVPELTGRWVEQLAADHGYSHVAMEDELPIVSSRRGVQWIGVKSTESGKDAALVVWDDAVRSADEVVVSANGADGSALKIKEFDRIPIPENVRKELVYGGFPKPPKEVAWVVVSLPDSLGNANMRTLQVKYSGGDEIVRVFTK